MVALLKYTFSKLYFFYGEILGIKQNVFIYPSIAIGFFLAFNLLTILSVILLLFSAPFLGMLYPVVGVGIILIAIFYTSLGGHYKKILEEVNSYGDCKRSKLKLSSIIYAVVSITMFFWVYWLYYQDLV